MQLSTPYLKPACVDCNIAKRLAGAARAVRVALARHIVGDSGWRDDAGCSTRLRVPPRVWQRHGAFLADIARSRSE